MSKQVKNSAKKNVQNVELKSVVINKRTESGKTTTQEIQVLSNYQEYLDNIKSLDSFEVVTFATKYTEKSKIILNKLDDEYVQKQCEERNTQFTEKSAWRCVYYAKPDKDVRDDNPFYLMTYNNELVVHDLQVGEVHKIVPVAFYTARMVKLDVSYDANKRETAVGKERNSHAKQFNIETCENIEQIQAEKAKLLDKVAAMDARIVYLNSDEFSNEKATRKLNKQFNLDKIESEEDALRLIAMIQSKLTK